ncbi:MAG: dihydroorotate dehydrogenase-like protein [Actinomycetota bacterium]|nr:dihydroorotate dehydrogenase-like protein [Actinomycetota bacterium]
MDLSTRYLGLALANPVVASASPLSHTVEGVRRLARGGVGAVVLHSLFEEELDEEIERQARLVEAGTESFAESLTYFPDVPGADRGAAYYLSLLERAVAAVEIPVIASLNGATPGGWTSYARQMQEAGAAALELNLYASPATPGTPGREIENRHIDILERVKAAVSVPVTVKLSPYYTSVGEMALRLRDAGADGLVLFNRFLHPDIEPGGFAAVPSLGLSHPMEGRLPRAWIALLRRHVAVDLAGSTGIEGPEDVVRYLLAGADVVMTTSALLRHGPEHALALVQGVATWMEGRGFEHVSELRGLDAIPLGDDAAAHERGAYVAALREANATLEGPW